MLKLLTDTNLNDRQQKALKGTYNQLLKSASEEAQRIKRERDEATQSKLEERPAKRATCRTESHRYETKLTHTNLPSFDTLHSDTAPGVQKSPLFHLLLWLTNIATLQPLQCRSLLCVHSTKNCASLCIISLSLSI